ncbi:MAG TPA: ABC transporter permease [Thermoanaerobaculia bacterium]|nr:ABC transporter permease [Thermoanaerobaculia bacterium]
MIETLRHDLALAARSLSRAPGFTAAVVLTLALGIGGTATMFTAVNAAYLKPLPYPEAGRVTLLWQTYKEFHHVSVSMLDALDWAARNRTYEHMAAFAEAPVNVSGGPNPARVPAGYVTRDFFAAFGVSPRLGRTFSAEELVNNGPRGVVISHGVWRRIFQSDPRVLERTLGLEGVDFPVIGVMPPGFAYPEKAEVWLPLPTDDGAARSAHNYSVVGRLKPSVSVEQAQADMSSVQTALAHDYPADDGENGVEVVSLRRDLLGPTGPVLLLLLGAVSFVLLIACANVANLLLARSLARRGEATVRLALGANRLALIRPFVLESILLSLLGGALGLALAAGGSRFLAGLAPARVLDPASFRVDGAVLLFTFGVALAVGLLCGLAPALRASRQDLRTALSVGGRGTTEGRRGMRMLIAAEVAVAFVLLVGAGLLLRSAWRLEQVDPGFQPRGVTVLRFAMSGLPGSRYDDAKWRSRFFSQLLERAAALPGVRRVGAVNELPLADRTSNGTLELEDQAGEAPGQTLNAHYRLAGGDYFAAMGIPMLSGQTFPADLGPDAPNAPHIALVNERLAHDLGGLVKALGRRVTIPGMDGVKEKATVIGIVGNVHHRGLSGDPVPEIYFPFVQRPMRTWKMSVVVQATGPGIGQRLRETAKALDPGLPAEVRTMDGFLTDDLAQTHFRARLLTGFAAMALLLAGVGIFGVVAYAVRRRHREVGIRMALGADQGKVLSLVIREGMVPVLLGMALGLAAALALTRLLASLVYAINVTDPATFLGVALVLGLAGLFSTYIPSQWATQIDPVEALRAE